jgi:hypothetical protein
MIRVARLNMCVTEYSDLFLILRIIPHGEKFGIVLMLVNPAWQEKFCDGSCVFVYPA